MAPSVASDKARQLRNSVREAYDAAAREPHRDHAFPVGREFAESIGYPRDMLATVPPASVEAFSGVSNLSIFAEIARGSRVLDLGCGAGLDSLIAATRTGPDCIVVGVDFSASMLERAIEAAHEADRGNAIFCRADAEALPIKRASIDVALVNGIFNLNPAREVIFTELSRVVRAGGSVYAAELILREPLPPRVRASEADWFA